eukprot:6632864-Prymnesium_polylepis.1
MWCASGLPWHSFQSHSQRSHSSRQGWRRAPRVVTAAAILEGTAGTPGTPKRGAASASRSTRRNLPEQRPIGCHSSSNCRLHTAQPVDSLKRPSRASDRRASSASE